MVATFQLGTVLLGTANSKRGIWESHVRPEDAASEPTPTRIFDFFGNRV